MNRRRPVHVHVVVLLLVVAACLAGCGSSASSTTDTSGPYFGDTPVPTDTPVSEYSRYLTWRSGMISIVGQVRSAYRAMQNAVVQIYAGDYINAQGHMQDAQDSIRTAQDDYNSFQAPSLYRHINWVMGQSLDSYMQGTSQILAGIGNGDIGQINAGVKDLRQGDRGLQDIRILESQRQWLNWLDGMRSHPSKDKSGSV